MAPGLWFTSLIDDPSNATAVTVTGTGKCKRRTFSFPALPIQIPYADTGDRGTLLARDPPSVSAVVDAFPGVVSSVTLAREAIFRTPFVNTAVACNVPDGG